MMEQKITTPITKGIIISLVMIAVTLTTTFMSSNYGGSLQWLGYIVFFVGIILSITQYGKQIDYQSTFGNYFAHGFKIAAIVTIVMIIYVIVFMAMFPEFKEKALEEARKGMAKRDMSSDQMDKAVEMTKKFFMVFAIGGTLVAYLFFGAIAALIGAAVTKKNPNTFQQDINQING